MQFLEVHEEEEFINIEHIKKVKRVNDKQTQIYITDFNAFLVDTPIKEVIEILSDKASLKCN